MDGNTEGAHVIRKQKPVSAELLEGGGLAASLQLQQVFLTSATTSTGSGSCRLESCAASCHHQPLPAQS